MRGLYWIISIKYLDFLFEIKELIPGYYTKTDKNNKTFCAPKFMYLRKKNANTRVAIFITIMVYFREFLCQIKSYGSD